MTWQPTFFAMIGTAHLERVGTGKHGLNQKIARIKKMVEVAIRDPEFRAATVREIHHVGERDWEGEVSAIVRFVQRMRYTRDPHSEVGLEVFIDPRISIREIDEGTAAGDCDDHVLLAAAMLAVVGHPVQYRVGGSGPNQYQHIWIDVYDENQGWVPVELIRDEVPVGWDPAQLFGITETYDGGLMGMIKQTIPRPGGVVSVEQTLIRPGPVFRGALPSDARAASALYRSQRSMDPPPGLGGGLGWIAAVVQIATTAYSAYSATESNRKSRQLQADRQRAGLPSYEVEDVDYGQYVGQGLRAGGSLADEFFAEEPVAGVDYYDEYADPVDVDGKQLDTDVTVFSDYEPGADYYDEQGYGYSRAEPLEATPQRLAAARTPVTGSDYYKELESYAGKASNRGDAREYLQQEGTRRARQQVQPYLGTNTGRRQTRSALLPSGYRKYSLTKYLTREQQAELKQIEDSKRRRVRNPYAPYTGINGLGGLGCHCPESRPGGISGLGGLGADFEPFTKPFKMPADFEALVKMYPDQEPKVKGLLLAKIDSMSTEQEAGTAWNLLQVQDAFDVNMYPRLSGHDGGPDGMYKDWHQNIMTESAVGLWVSLNIWTRDPVYSRRGSSGWLTQMKWLATALFRGLALAWMENEGVRRLQWEVDREAELKKIAEERKADSEGKKKDSEALAAAKREAKRKALELERQRDIEIAAGLPLPWVPPVETPRVVTYVPRRPTATRSPAPVPTKAPPTARPAKSSTIPLVIGAAALFFMMKKKR